MSDCTPAFGHLHHDMVNRYDPQFLAQGGEHLVYEIPTHQNIVVKVAVNLIRLIIDSNMRHKRPLDAFPIGIGPMIRAYPQTEARRFQRLKRFFGRQHTLQQRKFIASIPLFDKSLYHLVERIALAIDSHKRDVPHLSTPTGDKTFLDRSTSERVWAGVMIQQRASELFDKNRLTLATGYAELNMVEPTIYRSVTWNTLFGEAPLGSFDLDAFSVVQPSRPLKRLLVQLDADRALRTMMQELVRKIIRYCHATGETLDLASADNLVIVQKNGQWSYCLADALYPLKSDMMSRTRTALLKLSEGKSLDNHQQNVLLNTINFIRTINGLAHYLGLRNRLTVLPDSTSMREIDFLQVLRKNSDIQNHV
ncbi:hypothetical protein KFU94_37155 [Chloroflexi bacterium TSY]|nr:hypothetical protein [Chloroflexi bacterium TSY]